MVLCHQLIARGNGCPGYLILIWAVTRDRWTGYKLITPRCPLAIPIHCIRDQVFDPRLRQVYLLNVIRQLLALCVLSLLAVLSSSLVLDIEIRGVYLFLWYLLVALSAASLLAGRGRQLVLFCLCLLSLGNLHVSYSGNVRTALQRPDNTWSMVGEALMDFDFELLYGRWDFANMAAGYTDGKVISAAWYGEVGHVLGYINPQDCYAPEDNDRAVYLFRPEEVEEGMALAESMGAELTLIWETPGALLYTSDKQLMWK